MGAGYTGLWTAYYLLQRDPSLRVAIVEREIAGFGASGRNGGWCYPGFPVSAGVLRERYGADAARAVFRRNVRHGRRDRTGDCRRRDRRPVGSAAARCGSRGASISGRRSRAPTRRLRRSALPAGTNCLMRNADRAARARQRRRAGLYNPAGASVHPARLARGLARAVERRGATIYEQTPVIDYEGGPQARLMTPYGDVRAKTIVLAGEAYGQELSKLRRTLVPMYSLIVLTEPLAESDWAEIGWRNRELISSQRMSVDYLNRTADGRILFGGRGAPYRMHSLIDDRLDRHGPTHEMLRRMTVEWFPRLKDVRFSHAWGGPLGMPRDWMPTTSYNATTGIARAGGYTGSGVATANLFGRIMADLIAGDVTAAHAIADGQSSLAALGAGAVPLAGHPLRAGGDGPARPRDGANGKSSPAGARWLSGSAATRVRKERAL